MKLVSFQDSRILDARPSKHFYPPPPLPSPCTLFASALLVPLLRETTLKKRERLEQKEEEEMMIPFQFSLLLASVSFLEINV